jgi:hypothetical protein
MPSLKRRVNARMMQLSDVAVFEEPEQKDECIGQWCFCLSLTRCLLHLGLVYLAMQTSIGKETLLKLASVYRSYCTKSFKGFKAVHDEFEWIPSKILCCCYGKRAADDFK